jgi:PAS domain S-box-containing protein
VFAQFVLFLSRRSKAFLPLAVAVLCLTTALSLRSWGRLKHETRDLKASRDFVEHTTGLLIALLDAETAQRGFVLTGQEEFLEPYWRGKERAVAELAALRSASASDELQRSRVEEIAPLMTAKLNVLRLTIALRQNSGFDAALSVVVTKSGKRYMDRILTLCTELKATAFSRSIRIRTMGEREQKLGIVITSAGGIFTLLLLALATFTIGMSDRRRAQLYADLRQRNELLHRQALLLDMANDAFVIRDTEYRITYWNQGAERLYGWSKEEALGRVAHELLNTQFPEPIDRIMGKLRSTGWWRGELVHTRRDGGLKTVASSWTMLQNDSSQPASIMQTNFDISDRKEAEQELRASRERLNAIFNSCHEGIIVYKAIRDEAGCIRDFTFESVNPAAERMLGIKAEGRRLLEQFPNVAGILENFSDVVEDGAPLEIEYSNLSGAEPQWYRIAGVKLGDGLLVNYHEITQRKKSEHELRSLAGRLAVATEALEAGIWDRDLRTNVVLWDRRMYELYGVPENSPVDYQLWANSVVSQDLVGTEAILQNVIATKAHVLTEFRIVLPDGSFRHMQSVQAVVLDDSGEAVRMIGVNMDVTERKLQEQRERQLTAQLKVANRELEVFAYVASHDLKAPLRAIDNASRWLEEDLEEHLTDETRENMAMLRGRVQRMGKLLDDLLQYARIGQAADGRDAEMIAGDALMDNVLTLLSPERFTVKVSSNFAHIRVRAMPLQQILMNLIGNACKHHHRKDGCIEVTVEDAGNCYVFAVKDDGPGIPAKFHSQIFDMFKTLKPKDQVEGSGMGLAMVRKHVEVIGGVLHLESAEGEGSTFRFTWPKQQQIRNGADEAMADSELAHAEV